MIARFLKRVPGLRSLSSALRRRLDPHGSNAFLQFAPPGHFYSPIPDLAFIESHKSGLFNCESPEVPGIESNYAGQLTLAEQFAQYYPEVPFRDEPVAGQRYYCRNPWFGCCDALILYSMLRHYRPRKVIEVGSGFSSAVMLDTNELFLSGKTTFTFVEPYPERLLELLTPEDKALNEVLTQPVQDVPVERFAGLGVGDFLFIDSSHVAKIGSDVVHLLTNVLPMLNPGVIIHFHDIFWPFEYPEEWLREGRAWNENYVLKAFLQFNAKFKIEFFSSYLRLHHAARMEQILPLFMRSSGGSLWLRKTS